MTRFGRRQICSVEEVAVVVVMVRAAASLLFFKNHRIKLKPLITIKKFIQSNELHGLEMLSPPMT